MLDLLISDIIERTTRGFDTCDADAASVKLFDKICGFFADHLGSSQVVDTSQHSRKARCTHCSLDTERCKTTLIQPVERKLTFVTHSLKGV